jgi:ABC-type microcin C transport system permease subunit YejE
VVVAAVVVAAAATAVMVVVAAAAVAFFHKFETFVCSVFQVDVELHSGVPLNFIFFYLTFLTGKSLFILVLIFNPHSCM